MNRATALRLVVVATMLAGSASSQAAADGCRRVPPPNSGEPEIATPSRGTPYGPARARAGRDGGRLFVGGSVGGSYLFADGDPSGVRVYGFLDQLTPYVAPHVLYVQANGDPGGCVKPPS